MKWKSFIILIVTVLLVIIIYASTKDNKISYLVLGDYLVNTANSYTAKFKKKLIKNAQLRNYVTDYNKNDMRITDLINAINNNQSKRVDNKDKTIKNAIIKADKIIVSVGSNDLFYRLDNKPSLDNNIYNIVDEIVEDADNLYKLIRKNSKEKVMITGFYNPYEKEYDELIYYANKKLKAVIDSYNMVYIDISSCVVGDKHRINVKLTENENICIYKKIVKIKGCK